MVFTNSKLWPLDAPATFERLLELVLQGLQWKTCLVYLDDIIIFGATFEEHMWQEQEILQCLRDANLKLQPSKFNLLQTQVDFLGHVINEDSVLPNPENVSEILNWSQPRSHTQVRQFLGMASYYKRFVKDFAKVEKPLVNLPCKNQVFKWTEESESAFKVLTSIIRTEDHGIPNTGRTIYSGYGSERFCNRQCFVPSSEW